MELFLMVFKRLNGKSPFCHLIVEKDLHYFLFRIYYSHTDMVNKNTLKQRKS
jgi:hypothetical protein